MLKYPNKHEKKVTTTAAGGTKPGDGRMTLNTDGSVTPTPPGEGGGMMDGILSFLGIGGGGGTPPPKLPGSPKGATGDILRGLQGQNTKGWNANQIKAFVNKVVAQSGGTVSPEEAKEILKQSMSN